MISTSLHSVTLLAVLRAGLGEGRGLVGLVPVRLVVHARDPALFEIVGAGIGEAEGTVVAARVRQPRGVAAEMPFAGEIGAIARSLHKLADRHDAVVHNRVVTGLAAVLDRKSVV